MMEKYDAIEKSLDVETKIVSTEVESVEQIAEEIVKKDPQKDYEYSRNQLYNLINKGQEAIDGILEVAQESGHPRAYEVAVNAMKQVGDLTDKLLDLQKKMKDLDEVVKGPTTVNNSLFVGSTAELSKLIKQGLLNNIEQ
jgi:hypothetical protein